MRAGYFFRKKILKNPNFFWNCILFDIHSTLLFCEHISHSLFLCTCFLYALLLKTRQKFPRGIRHRHKTELGEKVLGF